MLTIDPNIRIFVVIPLVFMNFCLCIIKAYALKIFGIGKTKDVMQSRTDQTIKRVSKLIENGAFIPSSAFEARRHFYNELDNGYLEKFKKPEQSMSTMFNDPNVLMGMMKNNMVNMMVMIVFGQWVNAVLSGYIVAKLPFAISSGFKQMFQGGISNVSLDASWISSTSFYYLGLFGIDDIAQLFVKKSEDDYHSNQHEQQSPELENVNKIIEASKEHLKSINHEYVLCYHNL